MSLDSSRKSSMSHWSSIERRRQRQLYFQEEKIPFMTVAVSIPADFSGAATEMHANRVETQSQIPSLMDFCPYEDISVEDLGKLLLEVQWSMSFRMFRTLENAIFDFAKKWVPNALATNNFVSGERKEPPFLYLERMLVDGIESVTIIGDQIRTHKLDQIYQMVHYMASLLRDQISNETKTILEDRLRASIQVQEISIDWLEINRLKKQEIEIKRDLTYVTEGFEALYANTLQALENMMQPLTDALTDDLFHNPPMLLF